MMAPWHWAWPQLIPALGRTLIHFLWQGCACALVFWLISRSCRTPTGRHNAGIAALVLMLAGLLVTFSVLREDPVPRTSFALSDPAAFVVRAVTSAISLPGPRADSRLRSLDWLSIVVLTWAAGVLLLAMRALGGWLLLGRLRRRSVDRVAPELLACCLGIQRKLGLTRPVQFCRSRLLEVPAVVGWWRPILLLPVSAITGLTPSQFEGVIAHELAHIKRHDYLVNLFQIAMEALLFYHPAVWWVSSRVRAERENCCDDAAVAICGSAVVYARALTLLEERRAVPAVALAANGAPLRSRVARLLGLSTIAAGAPGFGSVLLVLFCLAGSILAGSWYSNDTFLASVLRSDAKGKPGGTTAVGMEGAGTAMAGRKAALTLSQPATSPTVTLAQAGAKPEQRQERAGEDSVPGASSEQPAESGSYIGDLHALGLKNLTVDQLIALKVQGITPAYIRAIRSEGLNPGVDQLIAFKVHGVSPEYLRDLRASGLHPVIDQVIALRVQGVSAAYVQEFRSAGWTDLNVDQLIGLRVQGVTASYATELKKLGLPNISIDDLIGCKVQGVTPDYVRELSAAGLRDLSVDDVVSAKVQGITPAFIEKARQHGFKDLSIERLLELKHTGVF